jgi:hypothetical protein
MGVVGNGRAHHVHDVPTAAEALTVAAPPGPSGVDFPAAASRADQPIPPLGNRSLDPVSLRVLGWIRLNLVLTQLAPHD